jgi:23S rRNA (guanine745-N1)-methyltransferase
MISARRNFLNTGAYYPMAKRVSELVGELAPKSASVIDMGCGEGYYTDLIEKTLKARDGESFVSALDISKDDVRFAAKRNKSVSFIVASSYKIPSEDESFDLAVNIFSPLAIEELGRILKRGGKYIMVIPDKAHLFGLKKILYKNPYENEPQPTELSGFRLISEERISFPLLLDSKEKIAGLFNMTPYAYRTPPESKARLAEKSSVECRAEFIILCYEKL